MMTITLPYNEVIVTWLLTGCQDNVVNDVTNRVRLEPCHVHVEPPMKPEAEQLTYPAELTESLNLDVTIGESGLTISGSAFDISCLAYSSLLRVV